MCKFSIMLCAVFMVGCVATSSPRSSSRSSSAIRVGPGAEDLVIDQSTGSARLIIACGDHRDKRYGEVWVASLDGNHRAVMKRVGEPTGFAFRPHGIDLVTVHGQAKLFVVNHEDVHQQQSVVVYAVRGDELVFEKAHRDEAILVSPNDVAALPDGSFYVTNDYGVGAQEATRWMRGDAVSTVAYCTAAGQWSVAATGLKYANGIAIDRRGRVLVAETRSHELSTYERAADGVLVNRQTVTYGLWGADNLSINEAGDVIVPGHVRPLSLALHREVPALLSPVSVWRVTVGPPARKDVVFDDDGTRISGVTVAVEHDGKLYLGQSYGSFVYVARAR